MVLKTVATLAAGLLTAGGALAGIGTLGTDDAAAPSLSASSTASSEGPSTPDQVTCHRKLRKLPAELRSDVRTARKLPVGQRGPALRKIRLKALHGDYGTRAQTWSVHRIRHRARIAAHLPRDLREDLRAAHQLPAGQRRTARQGIREKVRSGGYGKPAQQRLEKRKAHRATCRAQRGQGTTGQGA